MAKKLLKVEWLKSGIVTLIGTLIMAIGINAFIIPHSLLAGGVSGIAIILTYLTGLNTGIFVLLLNIPIFIFGIKEIDRRFAFVSMVGMLSLSFFLYVTEFLTEVMWIEDILASTIYGGLFLGFSSGIIFRFRSSTGGTDIVSVIVKKKFEISISTILFVTNVIVVLINATISDYTLAIYTLISMFISSTVMNKIMIGLDTKKLVFIVTNNAEDLSTALMERVNRGITFLEGEGAYTRRKQKVLYCVVTTRQLAVVKNVVKDVDENAFMTVMDTAEIHGSGFKKPVF
ncbi:MAG: YitT family protein [Senegalia sp. (in: firmicutes)]|uniref:YitT family protein n=1 Tax=Senegalia sp. (in: firmicutes) TaxID=1924098 RepID=UPI003F9EA08A